jgi:cytochrome c5
MFSRLTAFSAALGLVVLVACGGGEGGETEAASGDAGMAEASEAMAEGSGSEQQAELPEGVTAEMVSQGKEIYAGAGLCYVCHGAEGQGMPGLGADLTSGEWTHSDGSFEGVTASIMDGVDASVSTTRTFTR